MASTHGFFAWYELLTSDADAAQQFYADVIGWNIADSGMPDMDYRMCTMPTGAIAGLMQITPAMAQGGARPCWLGYLSVADIDATLASVTAAGATIMVPPTEIPEVGHWSMIGDPQGRPVYVMQLAEDASTAFDGSAVGHCAWNELATPDAAAAQQFYTSQFDWTLGETMNMGDMGDYCMFRRGEAHTGAIMSAGASPPLWQFYFRVPNLGTAIEKLKAGGGTLIHGPQAVPGDDEIAIAVDPQGAMFALVALRG